MSCAEEVGRVTERRVTLITGSRKGIGRLLAEHYSRGGHTVIGCSREPAEPLEQYEHFVLDVSDEKAVKGMILTIFEKYGRLDHLINNAGIAATGHMLLAPLATAERVFRTNVIGTLLVSREAAKIMKRRSFGRIVNFSSVAVPHRLAGEAIYASSKAAVVSLTEISARDFAPFGITVNAVGPTPLHTDLIAAMPPAKVKDVVARQAVNRVVTIQDISNVIDFFLRPESGFVTGQVIYLGGL
jgi:3-oxoacyl-[acyl-carrier protein] reductase